MAPSITFRPANASRRNNDRVLPLINIIFLLLIFFMLAGRFAATDPFEVEPPRSISDAADDPTLMIIQFGRDGEVAVDGEPMDPRTLDRELRERLSADPPSGVRIKAHGAAQAADVLKLVEYLGDAGIGDLRLMTTVK